MFDKPPDSESWAAVMMMCDHIRHRSNEMVEALVRLLYAVETYTRQSKID